MRLVVSVSTHARVLSFSIHATKCLLRRQSLSQRDKLHHQCGANVQDSKGAIGI